MGSEMSTAFVLEGAITKYTSPNVLRLLCALRLLSTVAAQLHEMAMDNGEPENAFTDGMVWGGLRSAIQAVEYTLGNPREPYPDYLADILHNLDSSEGWVQAAAKRLSDDDESEVSAEAVRDARKMLTRLLT